MARRVIALALWVYFGWFLAATLAVAVGISPAVGPIGGVLVGALALVDRRRLGHRPAGGRYQASVISE